MNNTNRYHILSVRKRRKHVAAVAIQPALELDEIKWESDEKGMLLLDLSLLEDGVIAQGMSLTYDEMAELIKESYCRKAKSRALWYLSSADHSQKGLKRKLMRYYPEYACESAVERMAQLGYIDDEKFARNTCEVLSARGMSDQAMVSKLISLGVDSRLAKECVFAASNDPTQQIDTLIKKLYARKLQNPENVPKVVAALARRGFKFSDIKTAIGKYTETEIDEEC